MKYLRKFATEAGAIMTVTPNVILADDTKKILYNLDSSGVYIQHIDGRLYTTEQWTTNAFANSEANGVAVIAAEAAFVIAAVKKSTFKWANNSANVLIEGIMATTTQSEAEKDFAGKHNTELMIASSLFGASTVCDSFEFPNGRHGYLPSLGEWLIALRYKTEIATAMDAIGGTDLSKADSGAFWSSTQYSNTSAWRVHWQTGIASSMSKTTLIDVCPFTTL